MGKVDFLDEDAHKDSLMVTPIGICLNYYEQSNNFIFITFNKKRIKLYDNGHLAIVDAALTADFPNEDLFPKRGKSLSFTLNGKETVIRGTLGESARISHNGENADINTQIRSNDVVEVIPSTAGEEAKMTVNKLPGYKGSLNVKIDDKDISLPKLASVNGELVMETYEIKDGDNVELLNYYTVSQVLSFMDIPDNAAQEIYVNRDKVTPDAKVYDNFNITFKLDLKKVMGLKDEAESFSELPDSDEYVIEKNKPVDPNSFEALPDDEDFVAGSYAKPEEKKEEGENTGAEDDSVPAESRPAESKPAESKRAEAKPVANEPDKSGANDNEESLRSGDPVMSAIEKARADAEKVISHLEFERAENALANMVKNAVAGLDASGNVLKDESNVPKTDKTTRELFGSIQNNLNKLKSGVKPEELRENRGDVKNAAKVDDGAVHVTVNGDDVALKGKDSYIFVDVFDLINFDLSKPQGKTVETLLNGKAASYTEVLHEGDVLDIHWKD